MTVQEQNDWATFKKYLNEEVSSRATSNKTILWIAIGVLGLAVTTLSILISEVRGDMRLLQESNCRLQSELTELKKSCDTISSKYADAKYAYNHAVKLWRDTK